MQVQLYYRYYEQNSPIGDWIAIPMASLGNDLYSDSIPVGPPSSTSVHAYVAAYDLHPSNPTFLPTGGSSSPIVINYPDDISPPQISFIGQSSDFVDTQTEAWVTDNHGIATASITVTINTGVDAGVFTSGSPVLTYSDLGLLTIKITESGLVIPNEGNIQITLSATDTTGNISTATRVFTRTSKLAILDGDSKKDSFLTYPNPFNPHQTSCVFSYQLSKDAEIEIAIYSLSMKEVQKWTLSGIDSLSGYHEYNWDGRDSGGSTLPNGVYLAIMTITANGEQKILRHHIAIKR